MKLPAKILICLAVISATACIQHRPESNLSYVTKSNFCSRQPVSYWNLPGELNRLHALCHAQPFCRGGFGNTTTVDIAAYSNGWLWSGSSSQVFTVAQQDAIVSQAHAKAAAARPPGQVISNIEYILDFLVSTGGGYFIGARASYSTCLQSTPS